MQETFQGITDNMAKHKSIQIDILAFLFMFKSHSMKKGSMAHIMSVAAGKA